MNESSEATQERFRLLPRIVATIHAIGTVLAAATLVGTKPDALYQAIWFPLTILDFPVSLLIFVAWMIPITKTIQDAMLGLAFPWSDFANFWIPLIVFGVFGTAWWFYLAKLFARVMSRRRAPKQG